jgi:hypothetical protein
MSHGIRDYYVEIKDKTNAWYINSSHKTWLLLRLNNFTGAMEFVTTTINPENNFGTEFPDSPTIEETFFDISSNRMFLWNGYSWINIIQIIVATYLNGVVTPLHVGTQVSSSRPSYAGIILKSRNNIPLRVQDSEYYSFMNEVDHIDNTNTWKNSSNILLSNSVYYGIATENIPAYSLLSIDQNGGIVVANNTNRVFFAITLGEYSVGQVVRLITRGEIINKAWLFTPDNINKNLFCDSNGQLTLSTQDSSIIQKAGTIIGQDIIDFYPQEPIYLNPSPTPTPTPSVTPSL